jgi:hypothetical protein
MGQIIDLDQQFGEFLGRFSQEEGPLAETARDLSASFGEKLGETKRRRKELLDWQARLSG